MLGQERLDCGMGELMCCDEESTSDTVPIFTAPDCCNDEYASSDADNTFSKADPTTNTQVLFVLTYVETLLSFTPQNDEQNLLCHSSPPLLPPDRQVLYQSFLL